MPFTFAHPAIVIPLSKTGLKLSLTGLVIGSMAPDLEYFIQMKEVENIGHHLHGILLFDVPIAILLSFLFHNLLRNSFIENLPKVYRKRFHHLLGFNWNTFAKQNPVTIFLSILIGIGSHLGWDAFTHHDGFVVDLIPALSAEIMIMNFSLPVYFIAQIVFSILGMAMVHFQIMRMSIQPRNLERLEIDYLYWTIFSFLVCCIFLVRFILWSELNSFGGIMIAMMGSILYSWLLISIYYQFKLKIKKLNYEYFK